ncbi:MAG: hypothetical protein R3B07_02520 [Polyangiaceae bacterium]
MRHAISQCALTGGLLAGMLLSASAAFGQGTTDIGPDGAHYQSDEDCAKNPETERCREKTNADVGSGGLGYSFNRTSVTRTEPTNLYLLSLLEGNAVFGSGSGVTIAGGGAAFGMRLGVGQTFPDETGGSWSGFGLDITIRYSFTSFEAGGYSSSAHLVDSGATVGYQYLHFGEMDPTTFEQSGFGFFLGYHAGGLGTFTEQDEQFQFSHGPSLTLSLPKYNAGTTQVSQLYLTALVLPLEDFFIATISVGYGGSMIAAEEGSAPPPAANTPTRHCTSQAECAPGQECQAGGCVAPQGPATGLPPAQLPEADF